VEDPADLTHEEFLSHILWRTPEFQQFIVRIWRELPPILHKEHREKPAWLGRILDADTLEPLADDRSEPPDLPFAIPAATPATVLIRGANFPEFLRAVNACGLLHAISDDDGYTGWWRRLTFHSDEYCLALGQSREKCDEALRRFITEGRQKWPRWAAGRLRDPHELGWWEARPKVVARTKKRVPPEVRPAAPGVFRAARLWVPIYEDTTSRDLDWSMIGKLQQSMYGKKRRQRPAHYRRMLDTWDAIAERKKSFVDLAREQGEPLSTVKSRWAKVGELITKKLTRRQIREVLRDNFAQNHDTNTCPQCRVATTFEELCAPVRDYAKADHVAQRARPFDLAN